jgi:hypothetical protein
MTLGPDATLVDVAFAVCSALERIRTVAVLTGGSAATYYVPTMYQSLDADFVLRFVPDRRAFDAALSEIGYTRTPSDMYAHAALPYTVEFSRGPLAIGRDIINEWSTFHREDAVLHVISVTDCVRDRFLHFWAWNDRSALDVALTVARTHREVFEEEAFRDWTERERAADSRYSADRVAEFFRRLR